MSKAFILPYLRKGLAKEISSQSEGLRASFEVKAELVGTVVGSEEDADEVFIKTEKQQFQLVGPVDVRMVEPAAISEIVPADKSEGYSNGFMPFIEFYEEDFPWRYTPVKVTNGKLNPWLLLLACKDDEFTVTSDNQGYRRVTVEPTGEGFYPKVGEFYKLAHVQVTMPDWMQDGNPADYVNENPDDGVSRLFCNRPLEPSTHYTMFLVPAFELGRRAGMGESLDGAGLKQLAWSDQTTKQSFPVYYQWSFKTGAASFYELAIRQQFVSDTEFQSLPEGLKLDVQETGLRAYRGYPSTMDEDKVLVDMPVALVKRGFDESKLADVPQNVKLKVGQMDPLPLQKKPALPLKPQPAPALTLSGVSMTAELHSLLELSPVFSENAGLKETEDPWVVPPVYGARHILAKQDQLDNEKLFLNKLNLRFRNRAAAGLGVSVVKRNQEVFTNRAWGMVEEINALNQRIREYYEAVKTNGAASAKATSLRYYKFLPHAAGLQADAAIRVANAQSAANVNAVDLAMDIALGKLGVRTSVLLPFEKAVGVSRQELEVLSGAKYWENHWAEIVRISGGYRCLTGDDKGDFFFRGDEDFRFLRGIFDIEYATVRLDNEQKKAIAEKSSSGGFFSFKCAGEPAQLPDLVKNYLAVKDIGWYMQRFRSDSVYQWDLHMMLQNYRSARQEYDSKWRYKDVPGVYYTQLFTRCLPPKGYVYDKKHNLVGYAVYMKHGVRGEYGDAADTLMDSYPNGVRLEYKDTKDGKNKYLYILPAERFKEAKEYRMIVKRFNGEEIGFPLVRDAENSSYFKPQTPVEGYYYTFSFRGEENCGLKSTLIDFGNNTQFIYLHTNFVCSGRSFHIVNLASQLDLKDRFPVPPSGTPREIYKGKDKDGQITNIWISSYLGCRILVTIKYRDSKKNKPEYTFLLDPGTWVDDEKTKTLCKTETDTGITYLNAAYLKEIFQSAVDFGRWLDCAIYQPNEVILDQAILDKMVCTVLDSKTKKDGVVTADEIGKAQELIDSMNSYHQEICKHAALFHEDLKNHKLVSDREEPGEPDAQKIEEEKLIDADEENRKRLSELVHTFAERGMTLDLSVSNFDGKYPIMAYPIFPDPTSFYLRELSERFILPSVDKLKMNSISCFVTNPIFEEAFLAGMNTEMGRELLWREYPTDERGSYFRKFWDQVELPNDFSDKYFDVKFLHNWDKRLGANHEEGKGQLVVFVIKSDLMMQYPQTGITLSTPKNGTLEVVLVPTMTGWLADDTYMAGFDISTLKSTGNLYLTFTETDKSQRFSRVARQGQDESGDLSSMFAYKHMTNGTVWGCGVKPDYLVVNNLHLDDDEPTSSSGNTGIQAKPKPNLTLEQVEALNNSVRPDIKR